MKWAFIPTFNTMMEAEEESDFSMVLAHLVAKNDDYARYYAISTMPKVLDNSYYELGRALRTDELISIGKDINVDCIILPDGEYDQSDIDKVRSEGFLVECIPAGPDFVKQYAAMQEDKNVSYIGMSNIHCCHFLGVPKGDVAARFNVMRSQGANKIHMLGMYDSVYEVCLMKHFKHKIHLWDTSAPIKYGLNWSHISNKVGKYPMDFDSPKSWNQMCEANIEFIRSLV